MKHKIFVITMTLCLILLTCNIVLADSASDIEENTLNNSSATLGQNLEEEAAPGVAAEVPQVEEQAENEETVLTIEEESTTEEAVEKVEIVKENTVSQKVKVNKQSAQIKAEDNEFNSYTVTLIFYYRNGKGQFTSQQAKNTFKKPSDSWSKAISYYEKQITKNNFQTVSDGTIKYTYTGEWVGDGRTLTAEDKVSIKGTDYSEDTTLEFYAQYTEKNIYNLNFYYIDNIANGGGSWSSINGFDGYTHTFKTPADVPDYYQFVYWKELEKEKTFVEGESISYNTNDLAEDTIVNFYAFYQPAVIINYYVNSELVFTNSSFSQLRIYDYVTELIEEESFDGWFTEEDERIDENQIYEAPELTIDGNFLVYNVYAKEKVVEEPEIIEEDKEDNEDDNEEEIAEPTEELEDSEESEVIIEKKKKKEKTEEIVEVITLSFEESNPIEDEYVFTEEEDEEEAPVEEEISRNLTPTTVINGAWALINLIAAILTLLLSLVLIITLILNKTKRKEEDEDENEKVNNKVPLRIASIVIAILSIIIFILTENMALPMVLIDKYTLLMVIILIIQIIIAIFSKHSNKKE